MLPTRALRAAAPRTPMIKFLGKRNTPSHPDHTPHPHPASPSSSLPSSFQTSFASYRVKAQQHGPLTSHPKPPSLTPSGSSGGQGGASSSSHAYGAVGGHAGKALGDVRAPEGLYFDRSELPERFHRLKWAEREMEAVESGGASLV